MSERNAADEKRTCPYCGYPIQKGRKERTCPAHRDLPALEQLDERYAETDTVKP